MLCTKRVIRIACVGCASTLRGWFVGRRYVLGAGSAAVQIVFKELHLSDDGDPLVQLEEFRPHFLIVGKERGRRLQKICIVGNVFGNGPSSLETSAVYRSAFGLSCPVILHKVDFMLYEAHRKNPLAFQAWLGVITPRNWKIPKQLVPHVMKTRPVFFMR